MCCQQQLVVDALRRPPVQPLGPILPAPCAISLPLSTLAGIPPNTGKTEQLKATEERTLENPEMLSDQILDKCLLPNKGCPPFKKVQFFLPFFKRPLTPPPPFYLNICPILQGVFSDIIFEHGLN